jgi:hypothetical protein
LIVFYFDSWRRCSVSVRRRIADDSNILW